MRFEIIVKKFNRKVAEIDGIIDVDESNLSLDELRKIPHIEQFLEKLTGLRFHINDKEG